MVECPRSGRIETRRTSQQPTPPHPHECAAPSRVVDDDVRGQDRQVGRDEGGVQVVHGDDVGELEDVAAHVREVETGRGGFQ
ncbi:hypothetical protein GCM10010461_06140 [Microbacterium aurantiacum]